MCVQYIKLDKDTSIYLIKLKNNDEWIISKNN